MNAKRISPLLGLFLVSAACLFLVPGLLGCSKTEDPVFDNPFDPNQNPGLPVPDSVGVELGNNLVVLGWSLPEGETAEEFAIFRTRLDEEVETTRLVAETSELTYRDAAVRNGRVYEYTVAAGVDGKFGFRSEPVTATPAAFGILIQNDAAKTGSRSVSLSLNGPSTTETVEIWEGADAPGPPRRVTSTVSWTLSPGDGEKTVHARYQMPDGAVSVLVSDTIELDTRARIASVTFDGAEVRGPGDTIVFTLDAEEPGGAATIDVAGLFSDLPLFDDGAGDDDVADDGIYRGSATVPGGTTVTQADVTGSFTDAVGNDAGPVTSSRTLSVRDNPVAVELVSAEPSEPPANASVLLRWTGSLEEDFDSYRVFRSTSATVDPTDVLVGFVLSRGTQELRDTDVTEGETYRYRVYVRTKTGLETGSNTLETAVPNLRPPDPVTLDPREAAGFTRVALTWSASEARDFAAYRIYRNQEGAVTEADVLVAEITDPVMTYFDDEGLVENSDYFYRVYVVDTGGLTARSNEVGARTRNKAPVGVFLEAPAAGPSGSVILDWGLSTVHDFASYRLYRDTIPTVSSSSTLVVEIDEIGSTMFRDTEVDPATQYYYRVYVVDDGTDPGPLSTGSNTASITTP